MSISGQLDSGELKSWFENALRDQGKIAWAGSGEGKCRCPFHDDESPSFSVNAVKGTWVCHAGCGGGGIKELAGRLSIPTPWDERRLVDHGIISTREYGYFDAGGVLRYQTVRQDLSGGKKKIWQRRPDGSGGWINSTKGVKPLPYCLPELLEKIAGGKGIVIAEGEKCADALAERGFAATTNHGGAGNWRDIHSSYIPPGTHVCVLPDADKPGMKHASLVAASLYGRECKVKIVDLGYEIQESRGKDIYDWFASGHTREELLELIKNAPPWEPGEEEPGDEEDMPPPDGEEPAGRKKRVAAVYSGAADDYKMAGGYRMSDTGNAMRLTDSYGKDIRYCHKWKKWLVWNGKQWSEDAQYAVTRMSLTVTKGMYADADGIADDREREEFLKFALSSENRLKIKSALEIAEDLPGIPVEPSELDAGKYLLNCDNGTLDLRSGYLRAHNREDMITKKIGAAWDENAKCPEWEKFMRQTFLGNERIIKFVQRSLGYALTGNTGEQCFFILHGIGSNGKSTLLNTIRSMLGGYARQASADTFMAKKNNTAGPGDDIAVLRGARFVSAIETEQTQNLAEAMVKQLTGGDIVSVRRLYENYFEFEPEFKIFLATNHKPNIRGTDNGIWRRIRLIPFEANIPDSEADKDLPAKLREEMPGILAWTVRGGLEWMDMGLMEPPEISAATKDYRSEMDVIGAFLEACCIEDKEASVASGDLFKAYKKWAEDNGERELSISVLGRRLVDRGFKSGRLNSKTRGWRGLTLKPYLL
jgi:putative DNA primase/helicase